MQCPECGFEQPDDLFCASCGVNILRYQRRKRWKNALIGIVILGLVLAAGITFFRLRSPTKAPEPEVSVARTLPPKSPLRERISFKKPRQGKKPSKWRKPRQGRKPGSKTAPSEHKGKKRRKTKKEPPEQTTKKTATDWFNEGVKMSDDSPEEIECYQKALKLDPTLAVAHYNLGVIYHSQEKDELAKKQFKNFLRYASDSEIEELPVENYYSLEKLAEKSEGTKREEGTEEEIEEEAEEGESEEGVKVEEGEEAEEEVE